MSEKPKVFLDASCWIAAAGSPSGGSAVILKLARAGYLRIAAAKQVLREAERNVKAKMNRDALLRFYQELGTTEVELADEPTPEEKDRWRDLVAEKDCHVLAGAYKAAASFLVTLDRRHILTEKVKQGFPMPVKDTKEFLESFLSSACSSRPGQADVPQTEGLEQEQQMERCGETKGKAAVECPKQEAAGSVRAELKPGQ